MIRSAHVFCRYPVLAPMYGTGPTCTWRAYEHQVLVRLNVGSGHPFLEVRHLLFTHVVLHVGVVVVSIAVVVVAVVVVVVVGGDGVGGGDRGDVGCWRGVDVRISRTQADRATSNGKYLIPQME